MAFWKKPQGKWKIALVIVLAVIMLLGIGAWLLFGWNRFYLTLEILDGNDLILEYAQPYAGPEIRPVVRGTVFFRKGWEPDVEIIPDGAVDVNKMGRQSVSYSAEYLGLCADVTQNVLVADTVCPEIILHTDPGYTWSEDGPYEEEGFTALDNRDGDITHKVIREESYGKITYSVMDSCGNPCTVEREIPEYDFILPELTLTGDADLTVYAGTRFEDPGCEALDNVDGDISESITVEGNVVWYRKGTYPVTYTVTDSHGNTAQVERLVHVVARPRTEMVDPGSKVIYLIFDDGPGPYTANLLNLLDSYDVKATFFVMNNDERYDLMRRMVEEGHSIGIHSVTHRYSQIYASVEAYFSDLYGMQRIIEEQTGVKTWLMRFPGGSSNAVSRNYCRGIMTTLTAAVEEAGFHYFDWNVDSDDAGNARTANEVFRNVTEGVPWHDYSIVLQHDVQDFSMAAVERILIWGFENGYTFLPLREDSPTVHHDLNN